MSALAEGPEIDVPWLHNSVMRFCERAGNIAEGHPKDGCAALTSSEALQGSLLILERGQCMFAAKVRWL